MAMNQKTSGTLYLVPKTISAESPGNVIPDNVLEVTRKLKYYIVEDARTARRYLSAIGSSHPIHEIQLFILNKHTNTEDIPGFLIPLKNGEDMGLMSEAGLPAIADPGAVIVSLAHQKNFRVVPLTGPSSIFLALMASGLNGQSFAFNGYLPIDRSEKEKQIHFFENRAYTENQVQAFIETPFRNDKLLSDLLRTCRNETLLCIAKDITGENESIITRSIADWKKERLLPGKQPTVFIIGKPY
jgi:16S rRNA (cytidine1402-2'-O)-methyltransferase